MNLGIQGKANSRAIRVDEFQVLIVAERKSTRRCFDPAATEHHCSSTSVWRMCRAVQTLFPHESHRPWARKETFVWTL